MRDRLLSVVILLTCGLAVSARAPHPPAGSSADPAGLVVHEWGTFTSVATETGSDETWVPQIGPQELPCFVDRVSMNAKGWLPATVRMETPVLYFYSAVDRTVDVRVRFRRGAITEWYPRAEVTPKVVEPGLLQASALEGAIAWNQVRILPRADERYPVEERSNHYYSARRTDASPIAVGDEREKFLFYRGVGNFGLPLSARLAVDGRVIVTPAGGPAVTDVVLFENRNGTVSFTTAQANGKVLTMSLPTKAVGRDAVHQALETLLVAHGLYAKEAAAMVETWRDSWFEEGLRLFYIVPRPAIDAVLPLEVTPAPASVARVFVGRIELITQAIVDEVATALRSRNRAPVLKYGRFLRPIVARINASAGEMQFAYSTVTPAVGGCR